MIKLLASTQLRTQDISSLLELDINRKKSINMVFAGQLVKDLLKKIPPHFNLSSVNLILCSGEGELQQTFEYFRNLAQERARPILFQNSLHNSTLGSLSLEVPNIASGITVSNGDVSFESGIDIALSSPSSLPFLIVGVDAYNEELKKIRSTDYGNKVELASGGCAALFIPSSHKQFLELKGPVIRDISFSHAESTRTHNEYYPAGGMEYILDHLSKGAQPEYERPGGHKVTIFTDEH
jgi:hypothetical protein